MEPTNPSYASQGSPAPTPPKKRWPFSKKITIIAAAILVVLIVIIAFLIDFLGNANKNNTGRAGNHSDTYIAREGYKNSSGAIGDATALYSKPSGKVISFNGTPIIQPCALVTMADIRANKLPLIDNGQTSPVVQNTYSGQGSQTVKKPSESFLERYEDANTCQYFFKDQGTVKVAVYQPFEYSQKAFAEDLPRLYKPTPSTIQGLTVYTQKDDRKTNPNETTYMIRSGATSVELRIVVADAARKDKILKLVIKRLKKAETTPMQSVVFDFKSPVMSKSVYTSCDILRDSNFKQVMGAEASPFTKETFASSIGIISPDNETDYNYAAYDCSRAVASDQGSGTFKLNTTTYEEAKMADFSFQFEQAPIAFARNVQPITPTIADGSFYGDVASTQKAVVVRKGRLILHFTFTSSAVPDLTPEKRIAILRPVIEAAVTQLGDY